MGYKRRQYGQQFCNKATGRLPRENSPNNNLVVLHADQLLDGARKLIERYQRERAFIVTLSLALLAGVLGGMARFLLDGELRRLLREEAESSPWFLIAFVAFATAFGVSALGLLLAIRSAFVPYGSMIIAGSAPEDDEDGHGDIHNGDMTKELFDDFEVAIQHLELSEDAIDKAALHLDALSWEVFEARYSAAASMVERMLTLREEVHAARQVFRWSLNCMATTIALGLGLLLWLTFCPAKGTKTDQNPSLPNPANADTVSWSLGMVREEGCSDGKEEGIQPTRRCAKAQSDDATQPNPCQTTARYSIICEAGFALEGIAGYHDLRAGTRARRFLSRAGRRA